ncbi:MAG: UDP-N-acetylmuramate--L-alanine ligase [Nitrospirae bacterium]|nr:UDP-N-acetylmuramate--L-alanine ligase [Nitrospirota bacterium]
MFSKRFRVIHFVGIGGIGMSGIAELLSNLGYEVTGSDIRESETTTRLKSQNIKVYIGHKAENIDDAHVLVVSSAVHEDNPEVMEARKRSIPVIPRAEMLAELARLKYGILIAGAHGKTTTTSLISTILAHGGFDPTVVIGGRLKATGSNARLGLGEFIVAEADESDGSFLKLSPTISVVTNIDREHMDFFKTIDKLKEAFLSFINKVPFYGVSIVCADNEHVRELLPFVQRRCITYGFNNEAQLRAINIKKGFMSISFEVIYKGEVLGKFVLPAPGEHNVLNSLAAICVALVLDIDSSIIMDALRNFEGIQRRLEFKGEGRGIKVYDDYGHHPAEIRATLRAVKEGLQTIQKSGRLFVVFQPHRYTRTKDLLDEFAGAFHYADSLVLLDIYPAGEKPIADIDSSKLEEKIKETGFSRVIYINDRHKVSEYVVSEMRPGDICLTLGAGDVWKTGEDIIEKLRTKK